MVNEAKILAEERFESFKDLKTAATTSEASKLDLSLPVQLMSNGTRHPISQVLERIVGIFNKIGFEIVEDREIEDDWHNFTALNTPDDHPARDMQDTYYLRDFGNMLLRTHTSSVQTRYMEQNQPPIRILAPGRVYRNETISARSHCQFHQVEGLYIDKNISMADLKQTLLFLPKKCMGLRSVCDFDPRIFLLQSPLLKWISTGDLKTKPITGSLKEPVGWKFWVAAWSIRLY